jgi:acetoin utilization protein AcuB
MFAHELINPLLPFLPPDASAQEALGLMQEHKIWSLPIVDGDRVYLGLISEESALQLDDDDPIEWATQSGFKPFIGSNTHIYKVLNLINNWKASVVPVLDDTEKYVGSISSFELLQHIENNFGFDGSSSFVMIEMHASDYVLSKLARIAEGENMPIYHVAIRAIPESTKIIVTLQLQGDNLGSFVENLERQDYNIMLTNGPSYRQDLLQDRYDALMRFLEI